MIHNPFESFNIEVPRKYSESVKRYCRGSGLGDDAKAEQTPFQRQVDFWFLSFCIAIREQLNPEKISDSVNITPATILSNDSYRVSIIQLCAIGSRNSLDEVSDYRAIFNWAQSMANAGIPRLLQILSDTEAEPTWNLIDYFENLS